MREAIGRAALVAAGVALWAGAAGAQDWKAE